MSDNRKRARAKHACRECNLRRVKCDVMQKHPCTNCESSHAETSCVILPSKRGKYPRKPRASTSTSKYETSAQQPSSSSPVSGPVSTTASPAAPAAPAPPGAQEQTTPASLFFGESNFLTLVPSSANHPRTPSNPHTPPLPDNNTISSSSDSSCNDSKNTVQNNSNDHNTKDSRLSFTTAFPTTGGTSHLSAATSRYLHDEGALRLPSLATSLPVLRAYFQWFHPCFPIVDRADIVQRLQATPTTLSPLLFHSMLFLGATYCPSAALPPLGFLDRADAKSQLYTRARLLFHADCETDRTTLVQSLFLLSFWRGKDSGDVRDVRYWLGVAITLAESGGLHRATRLTTRDASVARVRRRLWWSVYVRERQSAASLGLPMRVRDEDCDIEPLTVADLLEQDDDGRLGLALGPSTTEEHLIYPIKMVELARLLGRIIDLHFIPGRAAAAAHETPEIMQLQTSLEVWKDSLPPQLRRISDEEAPPTVWTCLLHLAYNHLRILIHRNGFLRHVERDTHAALGAASQISRIAEDMLDRKMLQYGQMHLITSLFAALCIHAIHLKTAEGVDRRLAEHRAQICLLGLKEVHKFWRINNTVLDLFLQYLDESIARRLRGDGETSQGDGNDNNKNSNSNSNRNRVAVISREGSAVPQAIVAPPATSAAAATDSIPPLQQPEMSFYESWAEGENNGLDDLAFLLDPAVHHADGLNFLERWL